jgi:membrane-bound lytic murein transglycosylase B
VASACRIRRRAWSREPLRLYTVTVRLALCITCVLGATLLAQAPADPATRPPFSQWLDGVRAEALTRGIRQEIVDAALNDVQEPLRVVIERDRSQAETVLSLDSYIKRSLTATRVHRGREMAERFAPALDRVAEQFGVPRRIIAGIWGIESNFGGFSGVRPTVPALATLAWDPRRAAFFRGELFNALEILNRGDIEPARMRGSWAGAMGQPQFMPSSYLQYAVDFDGDGRRDIWESPDDIFASIANYLKGHGWADGHSWGREVKLSKEAATRVAATVARRDGSCSARRDMTVALSFGEWQNMGVRTLAGTALPNSEQIASLVSGTARHFLVYPNYDALLEYNCAHAYALTVALLGDRIAGGAQAASVSTPKAAKDSAR